MDIPVGYLFDLRMNNFGDVIISWSRHVATKYKGVWDLPNLATPPINSDGNSMDFVHIAISDNGEAIIVWDEEFLYKTEFRNGKWDWPMDPDNRIYNFDFPGSDNVAMDQYGNTTITWGLDYDHLGGDLSIYTQNHWMDPVRIFEDIDNLAVATIAPDVVMNNCRKILFWNMYPVDDFTYTSGRGNLFFKQFK